MQPYPIPSEPPVTNATLPVRSGTCSSENCWSSGARECAPMFTPKTLLPRFSAMVFLTACIMEGFDSIGPLRRSVFSVAYDLEGICEAEIRKTDVV